MSKPKNEFMESISDVGQIPTNKIKVSKAKKAKGRIGKLKEVLGLDYEAIADYLANSIDDSEKPEADLVDLGLNQQVARKLTWAWYRLGAKERNDMGFSTDDLVNWIKKELE